MKRSSWTIALVGTALVVMVAFTGCSNSLLGSGPGDVADMNSEPADIAAWEAQVDADFAEVLASLGTDGAESALAAFDAKYASDLSRSFAPELRAVRAARSSSKGSSDYPPLAAMPFNRDGAVYLSGGSTDLVGNVIGWVAPKTLPGGYYHGGVLDLDKVDPNNPDAPCVQTAVTKGAGYESATDWRTKVNACVLNPVSTPAASSLNSAQSAMHYYCQPSNTNMEYGFFKNYVNIFNVVTKADNYTWYCTKVAWRVYNSFGVDIDSNSAQVDFTQSGLYGLVKTYYKTRYFYSSSKANAAITSYIADARTKIVLAEEIMLSPRLVKVFEAIRE